MNTGKEKNRRSAANYSKPIELIDIAIKDEVNMINLYERLKEMAYGEREKEILNQLQMDCQKHMKIFMNIYRRINRMDYAETNTPDQFTIADLRKSYEKCVFDSLDCVEFYRKIYSMYPDTEIKDLIFEIITDKQAHAIKMLVLAGMF